MILTGAKLDEMCRAIWGADWKSVVSGRLSMSRQRLHRKSQSLTGLPTDIKRELLEVVEDQLALVAQYAQELREDVNA